MKWINKEDWDFEKQLKDQKMQELEKEYDKLITKKLMFSKKPARSERIIWGMGPHAQKAFHDAVVASMKEQVAQFPLTPNEAYKKEDNESTND